MQKLHRTTERRPSWHPLSSNLPKNVHVNIYISWSQILKVNRRGVELSHQSWYMTNPEFSTAFQQSIICRRYNLSHPARLRRAMTQDPSTTEFLIKTKSLKHTSCWSSTLLIRSAKNYTTTQILKQSKARVCVGWLQNN